MTALYNEIDAFCCAWLSNLMDAGHITPGKIDDRSIVDLNPDDVRGYERVHFFAGIGVWDYALGLAGWPDDRPVWTGSCPCQPFSAAGKQRGSEDERHLWPAFFRLIRECRPPIVVGEQVAGAAGLAWLDHVAADLEDAGYAAAAANLGAHSVGAPHLRQRLYWVAKSGESERGSRWAGRDGTHGSGPHREPAGPGAARIVADDDQDGRWRIEAPRVHERRDEIRGEEPAQRGAQGPRWHDADGRGEDGVLGDAWSARPERLGRSGDVELHRAAGALRPVRAAVVSHFWASVEWLPCRDGKYRPTQPGLFPLAARTSSRVVCACPHCKTETVIHEGVPFLRKVGRGNEGRFAQEILQHAMLELASSFSPPDECEHGLLPGSIGHQEGVLQSVRCDRQAAHPSQGSQPVERLSGQLGSPMPPIPREGALAGAAFSMLRMWHDLQGGIAPPREQDLFCVVCERVGPHQCLEEMGPSRVGRLRAYGNAIVAPLAAEFIGAVMDCRP